MELQVRESMFYEFNQNNSGGHFDISDTLAHFVIIEAYSADQANQIAESLSIYFNGCDDDTDCPCCGDRWCSVYEGDGEKEPLIYGKPPEEYECLFTPVGKAYCYVYRLNGIVDSYIQKPRLKKI
ncbi:hypothetical protein [Synechococcus phage BUCT-ZZ01]|nr:hypothetical protein [Synechococcus phage BUCT-ZZ01]